MIGAVYKSRASPPPPAVTDCHPLSSVIRGYHSRIAAAFQTRMFIVPTNDLVRHTKGVHHRP
jgi:hypothetical protein